MIAIDDDKIIVVFEAIKDLSEWPHLITWLKTDRGIFFKKHFRAMFPVFFKCHNNSGHRIISKDKCIDDSRSQHQQKNPILIQFLKEIPASVFSFHSFPRFCLIFQRVLILNDCYRAKHRVLRSCCAVYCASVCYFCLYSYYTFLVF